MKRMQRFLLEIVPWLALIVWLATIAGTLSGCATQPAPQPCQTVPEALVSDASQSAKDYSLRVQDWLRRAVTWSDGSPPIVRPSSD